MSGKEEARDPPTWEEIEKTEAESRGVIPDTVEDLKRDLIAANERALACFLMVQHLRRELPLEREPPKDDTLRPDEYIALLRNYRREVREKIKEVPQPWVKCSYFHCGAMRRSGNVKAFFGPWEHLQEVEQVFCNYTCSRKSRSYWAAWRLQNLFLSGSRKSAKPKEHG